MDYRSLHRFSRASLKGNYAAALRSSWLVPGLYALYRLIPPALGGLLILRGTMTPEGLWRGGWLWITFTALWTVFCLGLMLPARCGVWQWFGARLGLTQDCTCFPTVKSYFRAACVLGTAGLLRFLAALPIVGAGFLGLTALRESMNRLDAGMWLFAAVQAFAGMLWAVFLGARLHVSLSAVPVLVTEYPEASPFAIIRQSMRLMRGQHRTYGCIWLCHLPAMLTVILIPFVLPGLYADLTLFYQIRLREMQEEGGVPCPT